MSQVVADQACANRPADNIAASRFLLIKAWGAGFWSDTEHVLGQFLIAELLGRVPIVYWGENSLYGGSKDVNAFEQFFQPVSAYSIRDVMRQDYTFFPPPWNFDNLFYEEPYPQKTVRIWAILHSMHNRFENVLVSDCWLGVHFIQPSVPMGHPAFGLETDDVYSYLINRYIRLLPHIAQEIEDFHVANLQNKHILAVHVRGSDKLREVGTLHQLNELYYAEIEHYLEHNPSAFIFLLTESEKILTEYKRLFKERLIYTDCQRTSDDSPIYHVEAIDKRRLGIEILKDTYLAARCDAFIGNSHSNVSNIVKRLKQWPPGSIKLFSAIDV